MAPPSGSPERATSPLSPPVGVDDWIAIGEDPLPLAAALSWAVRPECGGLVLFVGTTRDHSEGRLGVTRLVYEAYLPVAQERLAQIASSARARWPTLGRLVLLHRTGEVPLAEPSVAVACSAPHRDEAFAAARFCIDTLKETVPIWKRETWAGGEDWSACAHDAQEVPDP